MTVKRLKLISMFLLAAMVLVAGCKKKPQSKTESDNPSQQQVTSVQDDSKPTLSNIISRAKTWGPILTKLYGKQAPDFTVTDLSGKKHTLSEYRGKNVMIIFWATWCLPCIQEVPHLVELRNTFGQDKLAMLAISYIGPMNSADKIKKFVSNSPEINYTVTATDIDDMPEPYNLINTIPSSFFIDPQGRIKLVTSGLISISDTKAIIEAER